jgi:hypothetical protein
LGTFFAALVHLYMAKTVFAPLAAVWRVVVMHRRKSKQETSEGKRVISEKPLFHACVNT